MQVAAPRQGDELLDHRAELLGLGLGGLDPVVSQQRRRHVVEHGSTMFGRPTELPVLGAVSHLQDLVRRPGTRCGRGCALIGDDQVAVGLLEDHAEIQAFAPQQISDF